MKAGERFARRSAWLANLAAQQRMCVALPQRCIDCCRNCLLLCGLSHTQLRASWHPPERGQMQARSVGAVMRTDPSLDSPTCTSAICCRRLWVLVSIQRLPSARQYLAAVRPGAICCGSCPRATRIRPGDAITPGPAAALEIGGVHIASGEPDWRWDEKSKECCDGESGSCASGSNDLRPAARCG